jgi:hypothetical protein
MRSIFVVALMVLGLAFVGTSPISAAPANGSIIGNAVALNQVVDQVHDRYHGRRHHHGHHHRHGHHHGHHHGKHCWWHRGHLHCGWW